VSANPSTTVIAKYYQCGGINWKGESTCGKGTVCKYWNPYYSQCVSEEKFFSAFKEARRRREMGRRSVY
jgi:hypothetical protein